MKYYWIRVFDYVPISDEEAIEKLKQPAYINSGITVSDLTLFNKGTLLDEWYEKGEDLTRDTVKSNVINKYGKQIKFAKPRNGKSGQYAIVMDSEKFFYDRFYKELPDNCICFHCHKPIAGKACDFPNMNIYDFESIGVDRKTLDLQPEEELYFCSYNCKSECIGKLQNLDTIEFQVREGQAQTNVFGYIYHIYNRKENKHYIGQTKYAPFFRWQEHWKDGYKGNICDLVFETITEVKVNDQKYLNNVEAWWIQHFTDIYGADNVFNINHPHLTIESLIELYNKTKLNKIQKEILNNEEG